MKKRILSIALVVAMIVVMIPAMLLPTAAIGYYNGYVTAKVNEGAITIDGNATPDAAYLDSEKIVSNLHYDNQNSSGETSSFYGYTAADELGLYVWLKVTDQSLDKGNGYDKKFTDPETMEDTIEHFDIGAAGGDKVQLYIRAAGNMTSASRSICAFEFDYLGQIAPTCVKYPKNYANVNGEKVNVDATLVDFKTTTNDTDNYWVLETYIPWAALGGDFVAMTIDDITNFQLGVQANNMATTEAGSTGNDHKAYCYDTKFGGSYYRGISGDHSLDRNSSHQGSRCVPLSFAGFRTAVVSTAPVVDGVRDDAYLKSEMIDAYVGGGSKNFTAYTAATTEGFYIYADIIDDTLTKGATVGVDKGDKFQVYFQMGNRFSEKDWGYVEMDYRTPEECDATAGAVPYRFLVKGGFADNTQKLFENNIQHAAKKKTDGTGWSAEVFIPWAGRMMDNNFDELTGTTMAITIQANNYTDDNQMISYCLSDAFGGSAYVSASDTALSGNFYMAPIIFDFEADNAAKNITRWAKYTTDEIVLDGVMDEAYSELASEAIDDMYVHSAGSEAFPEYADYYGWTHGVWSFAKVYYLFTDTDLYMFIDVNDDTVATAKGEEFVSVFFENSESIAKFALSPFGGGEYITNTTYQGKTVALPASGSKYAENDMIALKLKGTADNYTGYTVEFKLPLTAEEKAALANDEVISIGTGFQANDSFVNGEGTCVRRWYGYSVPYGNLWWQTSNQLLGDTATSKVRLDKNLSEADFSITPEITSAQIALGESITMNYYATLPVDAVGTAQMKFTFNGEETIVKAAATENANEYVFPFEGIAPQCMGDNIKAELLVGGEVVATKDNYSVFQNCLNLALADMSNAKLIALVGDLGAYGAAAQLYANYKTDSLVNEGYSHFATGLKPTSGFDKTLTDAPEMFNFTAAGVYFDNTNKLYAKMFIDAEAMASGSMEVTVNGVKATIESTGNENEYIVYTGEILVTEFADTYTFVISDGVDSQTLEYSVNSYCQAKYANATRPEAATLAAATYAYGVSAVAYVG